MCLTRRLQQSCNCCRVLSTIPVQAGFSVVGGYMSPVNDKYGKSGLAHASHRIAMCQLAAADSDVVSVDTWEASQDTAQRSLTVLQRVATLLQVFLRAKLTSPAVMCSAAGECCTGGLVYLPACSQ